MRVLIVEDDPILALMASEALMAEGYEVVGPAHTVEDALVLAAEQLPDFAFVDVNLAGRDEGIALARKLRAVYGVQPLFLSGQTVAARAGHDAALGLLPKPYLLEDLGRSLLFMQALLAGQNPPPPDMPAKLEVFDHTSQDKTNQ